MPDIPTNSWTHEDPQWWFRYGPDLDWNGMDDRLQYILADVYPSQSPTAITGEDGRLTLALVIDFAWHPESSEMAQVEEILLRHGWVGQEGGAMFFTVGEIDSIIVDKVPQSALMELYHLEGVVVIEQQNVMVPSMAVASRAVKSRSSETYTSAADMMGIRGDGVVIAVLDSGVDNEHRSLNDFDDVNDAPDADAESYSDQKWLAGFDSTDNLNSQTTDGSVDPDDTAGHGTHVAGIAIGTGDASRNHVGIAPGAYLVDVKVFTDIGRSNSQYTISGMNWTINNKNTDWGNNASSNGIDIMSMSFGRARSPIGGQDTGDNGSDAEARLVNDAWDAGIVPVCAMGNDGANYVASPASADHCIAVAASDDLDTVARGDDVVASYSNWGPRQDDGDSDQWDELKPDIIAPGSNINSAQHAASGPIGGSTVLADDQYTSMSGTSMSTPVISGICALILQANPQFEPADVKSALQNYSEFIVDEEESINGQSWNASEGFGRVDAIQVLEQSGGGGGGGRVNLTLPTNGTWMNVGDTYRLRGNASIPTEELFDSNNSITSIKVSARYTYWTSNGNGYSFNNRTAFSWINATGIEDWTFDLGPELWHDGAGLYVEVRALDNLGRWSQPAWAEYYIGQSSLTLVEPSGHGSVSGDVELKGEYKAVYGDRIEYKIGQDGDWQVATSNIVYPYVCVESEKDDCSARDWSATWDSTTVQDGGWVMYTRLVSDNGWASDPIERYVNVDNIPAASDLEAIGSIVVSDNGIPVDSAYIDSFLNIGVTVRNSGDAHARNFDVTLYEDGSQIATQSINKLDSTKSIELVLGYHPTTSGNHELKVLIDPSNKEEESREDNNEYLLSYPINERPNGVDLALRKGAAKTNPPVPNPNGDITLNIRVENLGGDSASGATFKLEMWSELGWESLESGRSLNTVPQASYVDVPFTIHEGMLDVGSVKFRATATYDGGIDIDADNNQLEFTILVDESQLQGARSLDLPDGHDVLGFFGVSGENLLFTGEGSSVWVHRINSQYDLITCLELEDDWAGEFELDQGESDSTYVTWTRRFTDRFGVTQSTLSFAAIDLSCTSSEPFDLMTPLMLAEGTYWGIDISMNEGEALIGGYHRDLFTDGSYDDETSIFILAAESPLDSDSWNLTEDVIPILEPPIGQVGSVNVAQGDDWTHITFQATRDDETAIERVGTFYAHGRLGQENWSFHIAVGDETTISELAILTNDDGKDVVVMAWSEGYGHDSQLVVTRADSSMQDQVVESVNAPGLSGLEFVLTARGIQLFHDSVGPSGRQIIYSLIDDNNTMVGTPIGEGDLMMVGRSDSSGETHIFYLSPTQDWRARMLIDDSALNGANNGILDTIRLWTGLDERTFDLAWKIALLVCGVGCLLMFLASAGIITHRRRSGPKLTVEVEDEYDDEIIDVDDDFVSLIDEPSIPAVEDSKPVVEIDDDPLSTEILSDETEAEDDVDDGSGSSKRRQRRQARREEVEPTSVDLPPPPSPAEIIEELPPPPSPMELGTLPPPPGRDIVCECGASFKIKTIELKYVECPVCSERINL
jgi:subtilisin family serine protease